MQYATHIQRFGSDFPVHFLCTSFAQVFFSLSIFLVFHQFKHISGTVENFHLAITTYLLVSFLSKCPVTTSDKPVLDSQFEVSILPASLFLTLKGTLASVVFTGRIGCQEVSDQGNHYLHLGGQSQIIGELYSLLCWWFSQVTCTRAFTKHSMLIR